jgi:hypothetical protein
MAAASCPVSSKKSARASCRTIAASSTGNARRTRSSRAKKRSALALCFLVYNQKCIFLQRYASSPQGLAKLRRVNGGFFALESPDYLQRGLIAFFERDPTSRATPFWRLHIPCPLRPSFSRPFADGERRLEEHREQEVCMDQKSWRRNSFLSAFCQAAWNSWATNRAAYSFF